MRYSARELLFDQVTCFDHQMIFTDKHVDCRTVPRGYYLYEIRHEKDDPEIPYELSMRVLEDFTAVSSATSQFVWIPICRLKPKVCIRALSGSRPENLILKI